MKLIQTIGAFLLATGLVATNSSCEPNSQNEVSNQVEVSNDIYLRVEFDMPRVQLPKFHSNNINVQEHGAVGDGVTDNSQAFKRAIETVSSKGGGKVIVPRGIWLTGPIVLQSNINLHLEQGALITFSRNFEDYPLIETNFEGLDTYRCQSPISGYDLENIAITGSGIIDGSGDAWRPVKKEKMTANQWDKLVSSGGVLSKDGQIWYPSEKSRKGDGRDNFNVPNLTKRQQFEEIKDFLRPVMVSLVNCKRILLDGPTFQNSPAWNLHPLMCEDITIRNVTVKNPWYSQNGDGLDLESCKNALVYNNSFDVGDDAICFKSGKDAQGRNRGIPTENVVVTNNIVYHGHGGFTIGSEMSGGIKNVHISNCTFIGTDIGLRFKTTRGRGGIVENIFISNIDMIDIPAEAIRFNMFYQGLAPIPDKESSEIIQKEQNQVPEVTEETPSFRNIHMKDISVRGSGVAAVFQGLPEMKLQNVSLENSVLESDGGISIAHTEGLTLRKVKLLNKNNFAMTIDNSSNIIVEGLTLNQLNKPPLVKILGPETEAIRFIDTSINLNDIAISKDVSEEAVSIGPKEKIATLSK